MKKDHMADEMKQGLVYDSSTVSNILGVCCECHELTPQAIEGEIIVYYGGWGLKQLSLCRPRRLWPSQDYTRYEISWKPGFYRLLLPVPHSNRKEWNDQVSLLSLIDAAWQPAPVSIVATALLVHWVKFKNDLLSCIWCRCAEFFGNNVIAAAIDNHRVYVSDFWHRGYTDDIYLAAIQPIKS